MDRQHTITQRVQGTVVESLITILWGVSERAGNDISGIGIIVCDQDQVLPVCSLRPISAAPAGAGLIDQLATIASPVSEFHDGFHIVSSEWELGKVAQYFSPPIVNAEQSPASSLRHS